MSTTATRARLPSGPKCYHRNKDKKRPISVTLNQEGHDALHRLRTVEFPGMSMMDAINHALIEYYAQSKQVRRRP
jgi:hypothetical protein